MRKLNYILTIFLLLAISAWPLVLAPSGLIFG